MLESTQPQLPGECSHRKGPPTVVLTYIPMAFGVTFHQTEVDSLGELEKKKTKNFIFAH